jgi:hypothetical protein
MTLAEAAIRGIGESVAFRASAAPYLLLDTRLRIRAANAAYERATLHHISAISGEWIFDVFPDNPDTPHARGVELLGESFERALGAGEPDRMALQRYDVQAQRGGFVEKTWLPVNSPVRDADGRVVGVLHHVEDVTHLLVETALERDLATVDDLQGARRVLGTQGLVQALVRDSLTRKVRAQMLIDRSHRAVDRMTQRVSPEQS